MAGPSITEHEIKKVSEMMRNGWDSYQYVEEFEERFAKYNSRKYCLMTPCCTHAIHLALLSLNVSSNDEIIVPECTWTGSVAPVTYINAIPVFADISKENWCIDPESIIKNITSKTKGVISVNLYGCMPNYEKIKEICKQNNLFLIEDAAESLGSTLKGKISGSFGTFSVHSFHRTKTLTTGEGGALLTDDLQLYQRCKFLRDHGRSTKIPYFTLEATPKYMPSNLQGAMAWAQFQRIEELITRKRYFLHKYKDCLKELDGIQLNIENESIFNGVWATSLVVAKKYKINKKSLISKLSKLSIPVRPFFYPLSSLPAYEIFKTGSKDKNPISFDISDRAITLPAHYDLTDENIDTICKGIIKVLENC